MRRSLHRHQFDSSFFSIALNSTFSPTPSTRPFPSTPSTQPFSPTPSTQSFPSTPSTQPFPPTPSTQPFPSTPSTRPFSPSPSTQPFSPQPFPPTPSTFSFNALNSTFSSNALNSTFSSNALNSTFPPTPSTPPEFAGELRSSSDRSRYPFSPQKKLRKMRNFPPKHLAAPSTPRPTPQFSHITFKQLYFTFLNHLSPSYTRAGEKLRILRNPHSPSTHISLIQHAKSSPDSPSPPSPPERSPSPARCRSPPSRPS